MFSGYEKRSSRRNSPGRRPRRYLQLDRQTLYEEKWDLSIPSTSYMTQCYDMNESVSTYTNYNHYESTILELSHFKKLGDYGNGTRRYRCLYCGKAFSPLMGTVFDVHKIPVSEWIEYMIHLFEFHFLFSSAIKEDMDFLNDIDKESLTDALDTWISTSMSFKVKNKEVKIETTQKYNRFDTCYQTFLFVSFDILFVFLLWIYRKSWKQNATNIGTKIPQKLEKNVNIVIKFWNQYLGVFISLIWNRNNRFLSRWTLFLCSFAFKIDYILLLLLFVIVVGLIPSISAIAKSITKNPIKVINSED